MAKSIKGTRTEKNLLTSFAGESQARMRYNYFASKAKKEGFEKVAVIFEETANQEKEHAKRMFKFLEGGNTEITATYPAGMISDTLANLKAAAAGEHEEWTEAYPEFARIADEEGFHEIAELFRGVGAIEKEHEARYTKILENINGDLVFKRGALTVWQCRNCGHIHIGTEAPESCPVCNHPRAYFEQKANNY